MSLDPTGQSESGNNEEEETVSAVNENLQEVEQPPIEATGEATEEPSAEAKPEVAQAKPEADEAVSETEEPEQAEPVVEDEPEVEVAQAEPEANEAEEPEPVAEDEPKVTRGDLIEGTVSATSPTEVRVDLGDDLIGIVPGRELERISRQMLEELKEGATIHVFVVNPNDHQGQIILSINRALEEINWKDAEAYRTDQTIYEGTVAGYNKGGLIVRFGRLRGFVPQSQIADERRREMEGDTPEDLYSEMVNDKVFVRVMEVDRSRNRLILSERAAAREIREQRKAALIEELVVGEVHEGRVVSLEDFGAFVDVGGAEGLVHLTEISWQHVTHPRDVLKVGQTVKVEVISVDRDRKRIGLSVKRQAADPWDEVATTYQEGDLVQGVVTKLTKFGAFARLVDAQEIEGLIHISELSDQRVNHPREVVDVNEKVTLRVVKIDVKNRRLGLSLKGVNSMEYLDRDMQTFASESDDSEIH